MQEIFERFLSEYEETAKKLGDPSIVRDPLKIKELSQRNKELEEIKSVIDQILEIEEQIKLNEELAAKEEDEELKAMAIEENELLASKLEDLQAKFEYLTIPRDPLDNRDCILEIRAGAGGDEAGLFGAELYRAYVRYAERSGLVFNLVNSNFNDVGGLKELIATVEGRGAYGRLKHESGVHRVQRIPETEKSGRVHTSTVTVAVLPKAEETDIEIKPEEVKMDTFRSSGPGGQSVNTTDSAVRLTHVPSGLVVTCQDEKSQHKNKAKAFSVLRSKLLQLKREAEQEKMANLRSSQIGSGDRSEKIRTYNFAQDRITDHRIKKSWHGILAVMDGDFEEIFKDLKEVELNKRRASI
ncbi:MAG: peptide chain release factor 1 [Candidatus Moranbacteria bacterium]|nr:peptide chain release factor 1 [Candidatus Moranbacteria bacterium]